MSLLGDLLRRARLRGLKEGAVQTVRSESLDHQAHDQAERWQDYGFAANVVEGQGLVINAGGHTIVLRMDRLAERPQLAPLEVAVWHQEGHAVTLRSGGKVEIKGTHVDIVADRLTHNGVDIGATHKHGGVASGNATTGTPG